MYSADSTGQRRADTTVGYQTGGSLELNLYSTLSPDCYQVSYCRYLISSLFLRVTKAYYCNVRDSAEIAQPKVASANVAPRVKYDTLPRPNRLIVDVG